MKSVLFFANFRKANCFMHSVWRVGGVCGGGREVLCSCTRYCPTKYLEGLFLVRNTSDILHHITEIWVITIQTDSYSVSKFASVDMPS